MPPPSAHLQLSPFQQNSEWDIIAFDTEKVVSKYENTEGGFYEYEEIFFRLVRARPPPGRPNNFSVSVVNLSTILWS